MKVSSSLVLPIKSCEPEKICLTLENKEETLLKSHRILAKITPSDSAYQRTLE